MVSAVTPTFSTVVAWDEINVKSKVAHFLGEGTDVYVKLNSITFSVTHGTCGRDCQGVLVACGT